MAEFLTQAQFPLLAPLVAAWDDIRAEYEMLAADVHPWVEDYLHDGGWDVFGLIFNGQVLPGAKRAPRTMAAIAALPGVFIAGFSVLRAGARILPHIGYTNAVWRCHLPLIADGIAYLDLGGERHHWRERELMVFDDTQRHSAANPGTRDRVILMLDFFK